MHHLDMSTDASRALHDFNAMEGAYTDDADYYAGFQSAFGLDIAPT